MLKNSLKFQPHVAFKSGKSRRIFEIYDSANIQNQLNREPSLPNKTSETPIQSEQLEQHHFLTIDNKLSVQELNQRKQELANTDIYTINPHRYDNKVPWRLSKD